MKCAACLTSFLLLAVSLSTAAADVNKDVISGAIRNAVSSQPRAQEPQRAPDNSPATNVADRVVTSGTPSNSGNDRRYDRRYRAEQRERQRQRGDHVLSDYIANRIAADAASPRPRDDRRDHGRYDGVYCTSYFDCPFGFPGSPTFDELRATYRHVPDSELWNICLGRRAVAFEYLRQGACMMVASPDPWRPVDLPHDLEQTRVPSAEASDCLCRSGEGGIVDTAIETLPPCKTNQTLNRKRPPRDCEADAVSAYGGSP
jgi:hypothetical protein